MSKKTIDIKIDKTATVFLAFVCFLIGYLSLILSPNPMNQRIFITGMVCGVGLLFDFIYIYDKISPYYKLMEKQSRWEE